LQVLRRTRKTGKMKEWEELFLGEELGMRSG